MGTDGAPPITIQSKGMGEEHTEAELRPSGGGALQDGVDVATLDPHEMPKDEIQYGPQDQSVGGRGTGAKKIFQAAGLKAGSEGILAGEGPQEAADAGGEPALDGDVEALLGSFENPGRHEIGDGSAESELGGG